MSIVYGKHLRIKTPDGDIQKIYLYDNKNDVLKNGETQALKISSGGGYLYAKLCDTNNPARSNLKWGNKYVEFSSRDKIDLSDRYKITDVVTASVIPYITSPPYDFDTGTRTDLSFMFSYCNNLERVFIFDTSNIIDMSSMFLSCFNLRILPLFNTSNVNSMPSMFANCNKLKNVPHFDTSKVNNMVQMFSRCESLTFVPVFDIRNVKYISGMFEGTKITSVTFRNKPANLEINSQILCRDPNQITTINFI